LFCACYSYEYQKKRDKKGGTFTTQSSNGHKISVSLPEGYEPNEIQVYRYEINTEGALDSLEIS
jgi:hypothetical protein